MTTNSGNWNRLSRARNDTDRTLVPRASRAAAGAGGASLAVTSTTLAVRSYQRDVAEQAGNDHLRCLAAGRFVAELFDDRQRVAEGLLQRHEQVAIRIGSRRQCVHQGV